MLAYSQDITLQSQISAPKLVIVASVPVFQLDSDTFSLSKKFVAGVAEHQKEWPGPIQVIMEPAMSAGDNLDYVAVARADLPFDLTVMDVRSPALKNELRTASATLLMLYHRQFHIAAICRELGVPSIYTSEYTLRTRQQIIDVTVSNFIKRNLKKALEIWREYKAISALQRASGVQCNGAPTFARYQTVNSNPMLFFDTRITEGMLADDFSMQRRSKRYVGGAPIRLAYSGRLNRMKGADHLVQVALALKRLGKPFEMFICGDGELAGQIRRDIEALQLGSDVKLMGVLDFGTELVPFMRDNVDLFVCCHRQGDPSCTYLETMSCGVPIIGYANEALSGLASISGAGYTSVDNSPEALAAQIANLTPADLERHSVKGLEFAREHTFQKEFSRRMDHVRRLSVER